mmetsp:Transcript_68675/g.108951  ORF Transcript_68675/g.108951 Transcript_68675/m.108951 type:complete len:235 (-) Transcript_68675:1359-2063(-)
MKPCTICKRRSSQHCTTQVRAYFYRCPRSPLLLSQPVDELCEKIPVVLSKLHIQGTEKTDGVQSSQVHLFRKSFHSENWLNDTSEHAKQNAILADIRLRPFQQGCKNGEDSMTDTISLGKITVVFDLQWLQLKFHTVQELLLSVRLFKIFCFDCLLLASRGSNLPLLQIIQCAFHILYFPAEHNETRIGLFARSIIAVVARLPDSINHGHDALAALVFLRLAHTFASVDAECFP